MTSSPRANLVRRRGPLVVRRLAVGFVAVVVAGCSAASTPTPSPSSAAPGSASPASSSVASATPTATSNAPVTLTFTPFPLWNGITGTEPNGQGSDYWNKLAADYTAAHPNVTIKVEMGDWSTSKQTLTAQLTAGTPPDLEYLCDNDALTYNQYLVNLNSYIDAAYRADVTPATWDLYTVKGNIDIFPGMVQWDALIINADLFRERGVPIPADPARSWTWDDFMSAVQKLTFTRTNGSKVYGTAVAGIANASDVEWYNLHYLFNRGARFMDPTLHTFTLNNQAGVDAMQWLLDLQDKYKVVPPGSSGLTWEDAWNMLYRGQIAMWHGAPWTIAQGKSDAATQKTKAPDLEIVQYPTLPGQPMVTDLASCGFGVFNYANDPNRTQAAIAFAQYVTSADKLKDWKAGGYVPARLSAASGLYAGDANMTAYTMMEPFGQHFWSRAVDILKYADPMNAILPSVFNHEATPQQALDKFVAAAQPIFDKLLPAGQ